MELHGTGMQMLVVFLSLSVVAQAQLTADELKKLRDQQTGAASSSGSGSSGGQTKSATFTALGGEVSSGASSSLTLASSSSSSGSSGSSGSSDSSRSGQYGSILGGTGTTGNGLLTGNQQQGGTFTTSNTREGSHSGCQNSILNGNNCVRGYADPLMTGFTGRTFNFLGDVGKIYSLISSKNHQMSTKLKFAKMWDHNGTVMEGIAVMYKTYKVLMELEGDHPKVYVQDKALPEKNRAQKHTWRFDDGTAVEMEWDRFKPGLGNSVNVVTPMMKVYIWHTPKGIIDEGDVALDGYLNFNITLLAPPENNVMSGVIGDTYERFTVGQEAFSPNSTHYLPEDQVWYGKGPKESYEMANYWDTAFKMNTYGLTPEEVRSRSSLELDSVALVDLPATASFSLPLGSAAEEQQLPAAAEATAVFRRRLLVA